MFNTRINERLHWNWVKNDQLITILITYCNRDVTNIIASYCLELRTFSLSDLEGAHKEFSSTGTLDDIYTLMNQQDPTTRTSHRRMDWRLPDENCPMSSIKPSFFVSSDRGEIAIAHTSLLAPGQYIFNPDKPQMRVKSKNNICGLDFCIIDKAGRSLNLCAQFIDHSSGVRIKNIHLINNAFKKMFRTSPNDEDNECLFLARLDSWYNNNTPIIIGPKALVDLYRTGNMFTTVETGIGDGFFGVELHQDSNGVIHRISIQFM